MIFPDKLVSFQDSIIAKCVYILKELQNNELVVSDLFIATKEYFEDVSEFLLALDTLYQCELPLCSKQKTDFYCN